MSDIKRTPPILIVKASHIPLSEWTKFVNQWMAQVPDAQFYVAPEDEELIRLCEEKREILRRVMGGSNG